MTIGDVLAVVFGVIGICGSVWALLVGIALVFRSQSEKAHSIWMERPWPAIGLGLVSTATVGLLAIALISQPNGLLKLIGWGGLLALLSISALGASGLGMLLGSRVTQDEPKVSSFGALTRGTGLLAVAGLVPFLGWFFLAPFVIISSLGVGILTLRKAHTSKKQEQSAPAPPTPTVEAPLLNAPTIQVPTPTALTFPAEQPSALTPPIVQEWSPMPTPSLAPHSLNSNGNSVEVTR